MKLNKSVFYRTLFMMVLLCQIYLPSFKANMFIQLGVLGCYFLFEKNAISVRVVKILLPLFIIFFLGFIGTLFFRNPLGNAVKDVFHFFKPIQGILIGYFLFKTVDDTKIFVRTIVLTGFYSAIIHLVIVLFFTDILAGEVSEIREFTKDNYLELIALFFVGYYKFYFKTPLFKSSLRTRIFFLVLLTSCIFYLSRTMLVAGVIMMMSVLGYTKVTARSLRIIAIAALSVGAFYVYLYSVKIERGKPGLEAFLYKVKIAPEELFKTKIDRENHRELWDHWRGYEAKRAFALMQEKKLGFVIGTGHGSLVNLKFKAPLSSDGEGMKYISELHNGYAYIWYKTGLLGLLIYISFLGSLYSFIYLNARFETVFISALGLFYFFTTLTITGIYNTNDTTVFVLGALLFIFVKSQRLAKND